MSEEGNGAVGDGHESISKLWERLDVKKFMFLDRARECSALTIPSLFPPDGFAKGQKLRTPYQSLGARAINNLASKMLLTLFPPNSPFFRIMVSQEIANDIDELGLDDAPVEIDENLSNMETKVTNEIETKGMRVVFHEALRHLEVCGNICTHLPEDGGIRLFRLDQYSVARDPMGNLVTVVTKEELDYRVLSPELQNLIPEEDRKKDAPIILWTVAQRQEDGSFAAHQELGNVLIAGSEKTYTVEHLPWIPVRLTVVAGEDYGRSIAEEYLGDLRSLEALTQALVEGALASAKLLILVRPNGSTRLVDVTEAENGDAIAGNEEDVKFLRVDKGSDFSMASNMATAIEARLSQAFLLNSSVQRNAERVTAEEIRFMAQELEEALGGIYSALAQDWQLPLLYLILDRLVSKGIIPKLPDSGTTPLLITGVEALGRGHQLNRLQIFLATISQTLGPEVIKQEVNTDNAIKRFASAIGIDTTGLMKTPEQKAEERKQAQTNSLLEKATAPVAGALAKGMANQQAAPAASAEPQGVGQ